LSAGSEVHVVGKMSYAPQVAWLQQASIRDNIICCEPWDEPRYKAVVHACALEPDFANMLKGDETPIAEKGISLSGGQKQRVGLARAAYRQADIYVLDNPISALDDQTQEHIWTHLIEGLLQHATVIVASSRPVISCSSVLHLTPEGLKSKDPQVFNGWCAETQGSTAPPRYAVGRKSVQLSNAANNRSLVQAIYPSPSVAHHISSQRRRISVEDAAVSDVSAEVMLFEKFASEVQDGSKGPETAADAKLHELSLLGDMRKSLSFMEQLGENSQAGSRMSQRRSHSFARVVPSSAVPSVAVDTPAAGHNPSSMSGEKEFLASPSSSGFLQWVRACEMGPKFILMLVSSYVLNQFGRSYFAVWATWWNFKTFSLSISQYHWTFLALLVAQIVFRVRDLAFTSHLHLRLQLQPPALFNAHFRFQPTT
jgi:hypothetical protein